MKRILMSLLVVGVVASSVVAATQAVFSDTSSFAGNTISTATVDIDARNEPMGLLPKPLNVSGLVPAQWTNYARGIVFNAASSTNVRLYMYLDNLAGVACNKTNIQVWTGHAASGAASERGWLLMNNLVGAYVGNGNRVEITGYVFNPTMGPNMSAVIQQRAQLDGSADNSYQNTSCTWDEVFIAETP